jgi:hypothetical protein
VNGVVMSGFLGGMAYLRSNARSAVVVTGTARGRSGPTRSTGCQPAEDETGNPCGIAQLRPRH